MRAGLWLAAITIGCQPAAESAAPIERPTIAFPRDGWSTTWPGIVRPVPDRTSLPDLLPPTWQPGFHQALRWEQVYDEPITLRLRIPATRSGESVALAFRTGDGPGRLHGATIARAGEKGRLAGPAHPLRFGGDPGFAAGPRERVVSDPLPFEVASGDELYVTFRIEGHFAAGAIDLFPDSWSDRDAPPDAEDVSGEREERAIALQSLLVLGARGPALVAIGDSITEAWITGEDDYRQSWPLLAARRLGLPIANAAVSGQGLWAARVHLQAEVLSLPGVTDCLVLVGTNDLGATDEAWLVGMLGGLVGDLDGFCRVWLGTLPPKDRPDFPERVEVLRDALNAWIRNEADVAGVIDFERVLRDPEDEDRWGEGLDEDGVHPSAEGQRRMGEEAARVLGRFFGR